MDDTNESSAVTNPAAESWKPSNSTAHPAAVDLFVASVLALFLEVALIRWLPAYERVLGYFTNFVLIAAFLGLGLGAMLARRRRQLIRYQPLLLLGLVLVAVFFQRYVKTLNTSGGDSFYTDWWREAKIALLLVECLAFFFVLITVVFIPLGQKIGRDMATVSPPLKAYTINILGSLAGVVTFTFVSIFELPPWCWFFAPMGGLVWLAWRERGLWKTATVVGVLTVTIVFWVGRDYIWSPYNKLTVRPIATRVGEPEPVIKLQDLPALARTHGFNLEVNSDWFQQAENFSPAGLRAYPDLTNNFSHYELPYSIGRHFDNVLVVGAGTGNDVAAALRHGAHRVDAVEIDPAIAKIGRIAHPEAPYRDPRVNVIVDDARSYFNKTDRKYDLIVFALLDSHRLFSGMSSVRLDSFVYTVESFREAGHLLTGNGLLCVQHGFGGRFLPARLYNMLAVASGMWPLKIGSDDKPTFLAGPGLLELRDRPTSANVMMVPLATDDWPFFYMASRQMPVEYRTALEAMLLLTILCLLVCSGGQPQRFDRHSVHFFFLGAAFLLIETVSITRFALLFGSTWAVNSIVFAAFLLVVLLANLGTARAEKMNTAVLYLLLAIAIFVNFHFPLHRLLSASLSVRLAIAVVLMGAPIFFAALIFARSFKETTIPEMAFAANLLGAVVGGLTEYSSLIIGFRFQLIIALFLYALSYFALVGLAKNRAGPQS